MEGKNFSNQKMHWGERQKIKIILKKSFLGAFFMVSGAGGKTGFGLFFQGTKKEIAFKLASFLHTNSVSFALLEKIFVFCLLSSSFLTTSWSAFGLHWCRLDFDLTGGSWRCGWAHPIFDLGCHRHEGRFYVCSVLSRCLQEWNAQRISVFLKNKKIRESLSTF